MADNENLNKNPRGRVALIATDLAPPLEMVNKIGRTAETFELDVTKEENWRSLSYFKPFRQAGYAALLFSFRPYFSITAPARSHLALFSRRLRAWRLICYPVSAKVECSFNSRAGIE